MRLTLALLALLWIQHGMTLQCPHGCSCQVPKTLSGTELNIDCRRRLPQEVNDEQLSQQLDLMLSADEFTENLASLSISKTQLTHVPALVCKLVNLTTLRLDENKFTALPDDCFTKLTKLETLSLTSNSISGLQDGLFDGLQRLFSLDLKHNHISFIGLRVFSNSSDLTSLRRLNLASNRLTSLDPWWYYRCIVGDENSGPTISLYNNSISNFTNKLNFSFRCGMKRPHGYLDLSQNRITHVMDVFNGWNIGHESFYTALICLLNYKESPHPRMRFSFAGDSYVCDCADFPLYNAVRTIAGSTTMLSRVRCNNFYSDIGQPVSAKTVPLKKFMCDLTDRCPSGCRCVYRPANYTLHVFCSAANLSSLSLDLPPLPESYVKYKLDFSNNKLLRRLEYRPYFANTSILDVSNSSLTEITVSVLKHVSRIGSVNLRLNGLQSFPRHADTVNISAKLFIGGNPWKCDCDNSWMISWLQSLSHQISDPGDVICRSPSRMYGKNVLHSTEEEFCVDPVKRALTITLSVVASVAAITIITGMLLYKLRIQFYRMWKFHPFDRDECVGEDMDYDVFLSCSAMDEDPHGLRILREMESKGYRVCYHERDFLPGQLITDNMVHGVERSKRTVCLLSRNFLERWLLCCVCCILLSSSRTSSWLYGTV